MVRRMKGCNQSRSEAFPSSHSLGFPPITDHFAYTIGYDVVEEAAEGALEANVGEQAKAGQENEDSPDQSMVIRITICDFFYSNGLRGLFTGVNPLP